MIYKDDHLIYNASSNQLVSLYSPFIAVRKLTREIRRLYVDMEKTVCYYSDEELVLLEEKREYILRKYHVQISEVELQLKKAKNGRNKPFYE